MTDCWLTINGREERAECDTLIIQSWIWAALTPAAHVLMLHGFSWPNLFSAAHCWCGLVPAGRRWTCVGPGTRHQGSVEWDQSWVTQLHLIIINQCYLTQCYQLLISNYICVVVLCRIIWSHSYYKSEFVILVWWDVAPGSSVVHVSHRH